eukprot:6178463-Pleurochrysis_carterae.AAC.1
MHCAFALAFALCRHQSIGIAAARYLSSAILKRSLYDVHTYRRDTRALVHTCSNCFGLSCSTGQAPKGGTFVIFKYQYLASADQPSLCVNDVAGWFPREFRFAIGRRRRQR